MIKIYGPLLIGLLGGIVTYIIIKPYENNKKVMKIISFIGLGISSVIMVILLFFLFLALT